MTERIIDSLLDRVASPEAGPRIARYLAGEVERILAELRVDSSDRQYQIEEVALRADRLLAASEDAARLSAVAGYFAPSTTTQFWRNALVALVPGRQSGSRTDAWEQLATYPAVVLGYCLGIGASAARRYDQLASLFSTSLPDRRGEWRPLVDFIHPFAIDERIGLNLRDAGFRLSPFSDHLHSITRPLFHDVLIRDDQFEREFDRFELLIGLAGYHLSGATGAEVWFPLGRVLRLGRYTENATRAILGPDGEKIDAGSSLLRAMGCDLAIIEAVLEGFHGAAGKRLSQALFMR